MAEVKTLPQDTPLDAGAATDAPAPEPSALTAYVASVAMTAAATAIAVAVDSGVAIPNISLIFVVPVIVAGVAYGLGASLCSAVLGALAYNFFLTEPRYSLVVDDPANMWAIALLFVIALIVSGVAHTSRRRATDAAFLGRQARVLQRYSREVIAAGTAEGAGTATAQALAKLFDIPAVVMLVVEGKVVSTGRAGGLEPQPADVEAALSSLTQGTAVRAGIYPAAAARFDFWPLTTPAGRRAVIGLAFDPDERPAAPDVAVGIVAGLLTLALDR